VNDINARIYLWARAVLPLLGLYLAAKGHSGVFNPGFFDGDG